MSSGSPKSDMLAVSVTGVLYGRCFGCRDAGLFDKRCAGVNTSGRKASRHGAELEPSTCVARKKKVLPVTDEGIKRAVLDKTG